MIRMMLVTAILSAIAMIGCGPAAMPTESEPSTNSEQLEESGPALLLDEKSAISILQTFLQDCVLGWDDAYTRQMDKQRTEEIIAVRRANRSTQLMEKSGYAGRTVLQTSTPHPIPSPLPPDLLRLPPSEQEKRSWLIDLATGTTGDIVWSARHHGVAEVPNVYSRRGTAIETETWVVIGPGLEGVGSQAAAPGRWQVYAGHQRAYYLDPPARLALEEYDSYDSCP